jgi:hypothetical protein
MRLLCRTGAESYVSGSYSIELGKDIREGIDLRIKAKRSRLKLFVSDSFIDSFSLHVNSIELNDLRIKSI